MFRCIAMLLPMLTCTSIRRSQQVYRLPLTCWAFISGRLCTWTHMFVCVGVMSMDQFTSEGKIVHFLYYRVQTLICFTELWVYIQVWLPLWLFLCHRSELGDTRRSMGSWHNHHNRLPTHTCVHTHTPLSHKECHFSVWCWLSCLN